MSEQAEETLSRGKVLDAAFEVARNLKGYDQYGSEAKASKVLQRRCKRSSADQAADALQKGINLLEASIEIVEKEKDKLWQSWNASSKQNLTELDYSGLEEEVQRRCPDFESATYRKALGWVFMWHHLK
jgi:hypothetical protein